MSSERELYEMCSECAWFDVRSQKRGCPLALEKKFGKIRNFCDNGYCPDALHGVTENNLFERKRLNTGQWAWVDVLGGEIPKINFPKANLKTTEGDRVYNSPPRSKADSFEVFEESNPVRRIIRALLWWQN
jgi:hypothetical protein